MSTSLNGWRLGGVAAGVVVAFGLIAAVGTGAVAGEVSAPGTYLSAARSAAHLLGIGSSLVLVYYAIRANRRFAGGALGDSARATAVGAITFAGAFAVVELEHGLGVDVLGGVGGMQLKMAVTMVLFTGTAFAFGWAFYRITRALEGE